MKVANFPTKVETRFKETVPSLNMFFFPFTLKLYKLLFAGVIFWFQEILREIEFYKMHPHIVTREGFFVMIWSTESYFEALLPSSLNYFILHYL